MEVRSVIVSAAGTHVATVEGEAGTATAAGVTEEAAIAYARVLADSRAYVLADAGARAVALAPARWVQLLSARQLRGVTFVEILAFGGRFGWTLIGRLYLQTADGAAVLRPEQVASVNPSAVATEALGIAMEGASSVCVAFRLRLHTVSADGSILAGPHATHRLPDRSTVA